MKPISIARLKEIDADSWYPAPLVADLLGRSTRTVADWCRTRQGKPPRIASKRLQLTGQQVIRGATILAIAGGLIEEEVTSSGANGISDAEWAAKTKAAADEIQATRAARKAKAKA
ncbi:hypothetical protein [Fimbriiglobus ruber]|uniref:Helix-turn-helix domain-containing protein n=1 Tax=Fimbriiglobus ruber TaxID=1908690 RepID=A0A225DCB2_9BACT|nr:hypothetical protein [Fimbriiglobus ruber]OWK34936.1 hypothetical protein FRUB_09778 [Fimbriiglobus ruber]